MTSPGDWAASADSAPNDLWDRLQRTAPLVSVQTIGLAIEPARLETI